MTALLARRHGPTEARRAGIVMLAGLVAWPGWAQQAPAAAASAPATRSQQVEREAVNPLRMILEASRIQRANPPARKEAEPPARPAVRETRPARDAAVPTANAGAATPSKAAAPPAGAASAPDPAPEPAPTAQPVAATASAPASSAPTASDPPPAPVALPAEPPASGPAATSAVSPTAVAEPPPPASSAPPPATSPDGPPAVAPLRRLDSTPLNLPENLFERLPAMAELPVSLVVQTDGTVGEVDLPPGLDRDLARTLRNELRRWRFEPPAQPTTLQLRLVLPRPG